jgi:hypothetical protein
MAKHKKAIEAEGEFKKVPYKVMCIGTKATQQEQAELLAFLDKNSDVFVWSTSNLC